MRIGTNYNVATGQTNITQKAKEAAKTDQVIIGGNVTDNNISMSEQLKNMKSIDSYGLDHIFKGAAGGLVIGAAGTALVSNVVCGFGVWGTLALSVIGGAAGIVGGAIYGFEHSHG